MEPIAAAEPTHLELLGPQERRHAAVGEHGAAPVGRDERDDDAVVPFLDRPEQLDAVLRELAGRQLCGSVASPLSDEPRLRAQLGCPGGDVRRLPARADASLDSPFLVWAGGIARQDDDVEEQVAQGADEHAYNRPMDGDERRAERLRTFVIGSLVGASAVIAAARRRRTKSAPRHAVGLAAFEDAPCHQETLEREAANPRG